MPEHNFVWVELRCNGCGNATRFCSRIERNVPERLRCTPTGGPGGAPSDVRCPTCGRRCFASPYDLELVVEQEARGRWDRHIKAGAVVIGC